MTHINIHFSDMADAVRGVQRPSLVVEVRRDGSEFEQLSRVLLEATRDHFKSSVLFLAVARFTDPPNRLRIHQGLWPLVCTGTERSWLGAMGPSSWIPSVDRRTARAFVGLAEVSWEGIPWVLKRAVWGGGLLLIGDRSVVSDGAVALRVRELALPALGTRVQWAHLVPNLPAPFLAAVEPYGAFDDREAGLEFFGTQESLDGLYEFLSARHFDDA